MGKMRDDGYEVVTCSACGGCGYIEEEVGDDDGTVQVECQVCDGAGEC